MNDNFLTEMMYGIGLNGAIAGAGGLLYGHLTECDGTLAAQILIISSIARTILMIIYYLMDEENEYPKTHFTAVCLTTIGIGALEIFALQEFELIGQLGTQVFSAIIGVKVIYLIAQKAFPQLRISY